MKSRNGHERALAIVMLAALSLATIAPAALADRGNGRGRGQARYKDSGPVVRSRAVVRDVRRVRYAPRYNSPGGVYIVRRHSEAGPVIAGFLGGLFLGATLANAAPSGYHYWDPYCHRGFGSLVVYRNHLHAHQHPRIVRVIEVESGECVRSYRYHDGEWRNWEREDDDWRHGDRDDEEYWDD